MLPKCIASCSFFVVKPIMSLNMKGHFQGPKGPICTLSDVFQLISQKQFIAWSKFVSNTYSKSYMAFQFTW